MPIAGIKFIYWFQRSKHSKLYIIFDSFYWFIYTLFNFSHKTESNRQYYSISIGKKPMENYHFYRLLLLFFFLSKIFEYHEIYLDWEIFRESLSGVYFCFKYIWHCKNNILQRSIINDCIRDNICIVRYDRSYVWNIVCIRNKGSDKYNVMYYIISFYTLCKYIQVFL